MMQSVGYLCKARRQDSIRGKSVQPDSSACCCIDQKKKLQSGDVRATRKTPIEIEVEELTEEKVGGAGVGGMWEEMERRTKQSLRRADSCNVLKCAPARHTAVLNWGCAADLCVLTSLLHPPAAPAQLCCLLMSQTLETCAETKTKRLSMVCASLGGLKTHTGSSSKWGTKADGARNRQGWAGEGARLSCSGQTRSIIQGLSPLRRLFKHSTEWES